MPSANVVALQNAVNRIAGLGGFVRVTVDGGLGPQTNTGVFNALGWLANNAGDSDTRNAAAGLVAALVNADGSINQTQIAQSASGLSSFIGGAADALGAPPENVAAAGGGGSSSSGGGAVAPVPSKIATQATNIANAFKALPTWQKVGLGVVGAVGAIAVAHKIKKHSRRAA